MALLAAAGSRWLSKLGILGLFYERDLVRRCRQFSGTEMSSSCLVRVGAITRHITRVREGRTRQRHMQMATYQWG